MRIAAIAAFSSLVLVGCESSEAPATATPQSSAPVMGPGTYAVGDGTTVYSRTRLDADGSYYDLDDAGATVGTGTWSGAEDIVCFDPEGDGENEEERCWRNEAPDADGSFMSRRVGGMEHYRVTPLEN